MMITHLKPTFQRLLSVLIITLLTFSCSNLNKDVTKSLATGETLGNTKTALVTLEREFPTAKVHTDIISKNLQQLEKDIVALQEDNQRLRKEIEEDSGFRKYLPWLFVILGAGVFIWGVKTDDAEDTGIGVVSILFGMVIYNFWSAITIAGLIILIGAWLGLAKMFYDWKQQRKKPVT